MRIHMDLTYNMVEKRHPQELEKLIDTLRKSTSKMRDADPKHLHFEYRYSLMGESLTFDEVIEESMKRPSKPVRKTEDEKVDEWLKRCSPVSLHAKIGRWYGSEFVDTPPELEEEIRRDAKKETEREQEIDSMTDEERAEYTEKLLRGLSQNSGFGVIYGAVDESV